MAKRSFAVIVLIVATIAVFRRLERMRLFGTVGLSRGATGELDTLGRTVIMILMFLGRVGPLPLGFFPTTQMPTRPKLPESKSYIG